MTSKPSDRGSATGEVGAEAVSGYPALRWRGIAALFVALLLILGLAVFIALMREGRTTIGGISGPWALYFGLTFVATTAWSLAGVVLVAFVARRRVDDVLVAQVWTHWPLIAPATLTVMAFLSDVVNHRLVETDDLRWLWAAPIGIWIAG